MRWTISFPVKNDAELGTWLASLHKAGVIGVSYEATGTASAGTAPQATEAPAPTMIRIVSHQRRKAKSKKAHANANGNDHANGSRRGPRSRSMEAATDYLRRHKIGDKITSQELLLLMEEAGLHKMAAYTVLRRLKEIKSISRIRPGVYRITSLPAATTNTVQ